MDHFDLNYRSLGKPIALDSEQSRLDRYLADNFLFLSRARWNEAIRKGEVLINREVVSKPSRKLRCGDEVRYYCPAADEPEVDKGVLEVWREGPVMAVYKPSNLPMHDGGVYRFNTFEKVLRDKFGQDWAAIHRLDRETSGLVL